MTNSKSNKPKKYIPMGKPAWAESQPPAEPGPQKIDSTWEDYKATPFLPHIVEIKGDMHTKDCWQYNSFNAPDMFECVCLYPAPLDDVSGEPELPWPVDVFGEVPAADWPKIDEFATKELGYRIDRISGTLMRRGWLLHKQRLEELGADEEALPNNNGSDLAGGSDAINPPSNQSKGGRNE